MRNLVFTIFIALFAILPTDAEAILNDNSQLEINQGSRISQELREGIFRQLHRRGNMAYCDLCRYWEQGELEISKSVMGYVVTRITTSGTVIIGVVDDL